MAVRQGADRPQNDAVPGFVILKRRDVGTAEIQRRHE
jgi:hypothetical protein